MKQTPIPLRQALSVDDLLQAEISPGPVALGSFWAESNKDVQSRVVKYFKQPEPPLAENTTARALVNAYADMLMELLESYQPDFIVRVLAGRETKADDASPLSTLAQALAARLHCSTASPFYRSQPRQSMRDNPRLSGPDALKPRIQWLIQDLFILPQPIPGKVVLLDDIYNLGASARVYSAALRKFCGSVEILPVNLAATRFHSGKDGWGYLSLDIDRLLSLMQPYLPVRDQFLTDYISLGNGLVHKTGCPLITKAAILPRFLAGSNARACSHCNPGHSQLLWWKRLFR